jgi:hypothetical protein
VLELKQGDLAPKLQLDLNANLSGATAVAKIRRIHQSTVLTKTLTVTDAPNGLCEYQWVAGDTDSVGTYLIEVLVTFAGSIPERFPQRFNRELIIRPKVG